MRSIEKLYNKYFNDVIDKVTLGAILTYGICIIVLSILTISRNETILKLIVNGLAITVGGYISWTIGLIPVIRYYKIIMRDNLLENITPKNYRERLLEIIKLYGVMVFIFLVILTVHKAILPIINTGFDSINNIIFSVEGNISTVSFSIALGLFCIASSIYKNQQKVSVVLLAVVGFFVIYINDNINYWINSSFGVKLFALYLIDYRWTYISNVILNVILSLIFLNAILKKINKIDTRKIDI